MKRYTLISAAVPALCAAAVLAPAGGALARTRGVTPHTHTAPGPRTFTFYARVVKASARGLVVRTSNGKLLTFSAHQLAHKRSPLVKHTKRHSRKGHNSRSHRLRANDSTAVTGPVAINIIGLQPGVTVLITETVAPDGTVTVTITLPPPTAAGEQTASGVVGEVDNGAFEITSSSDGSDLRFHMADQTLSDLNLQSCDTVSVSYHQDAGILIADSAQVTGSSTTGDCAPTYDATGPITSVSDSGLTITGDQGPMSFTVSDSSVTDGFQNGDVVDVTYVQNSDGTMSATNVQYVESEASGTVTAVSASSVTITDSNTGQPETFVADPSSGLQMSTYSFDGVKVGDQLDLNYHQSGPSLVADCVNDQPGDQSSNNS